MNTETKAMAESRNQELARNWADGLDASVKGVSLADAIQYDLLRILGSLWLGEKPEPEAENG